MIDYSPLLRDAHAALAAADWSRAGELAARLLAAQPQHAGGHYVAGAAALNRGQMRDAVQHLLHAASSEPGRADYVSEFARALVTAGFRDEAVEVADNAMRLQPTDAAVLDTLGVVYSQTNHHGQAVEAFRQAVQHAPERAGPRFNYATALMATADFEEAARQLDRCVQLDPARGTAWLARSELRDHGQGTPEERAARIRQQLAGCAEDAGVRPWLELALSRELERMDDYATAFTHLARGKASAGRNRGYSSDRDRNVVDAIIEATTPLPESHGHASSQPIFLIGMPRSGTTLADRILSSHPDVYAAGELQNFASALKNATGSRSPDLLDADAPRRARHCDLAAVGKAYVGSLGPTAASKRRVTDKLPHNFLYAGFIARALPNAKIICLRRNPMDTCLGNFRQLFAREIPWFDYSLDLLDTGRYYLLFDRLMDHWNRQLPGRIHTLRYEELVDHQERVTRELLEFCDLPFHEDCLHFERNSAAVATASAIQVREPMSRASLARWKRYGSALDELRELLEDGGVTV